MAMDRSRGLGRAALAMAIGGAALGLFGCSRGQRWSYRSDAWSPKTITIRDTVTGDSVLTLDVPVGQQLNLWFEKTTVTANREGSNTLHYAFRPWGDTGTKPGSTMDVPTTIRIEMTERDKPEMPPAKESSGG